MNDVMRPSGKVPFVNEFKYLGFTYLADGSWEHTMEVRMAMAYSRFSQMKKVWKAKNVSTYLFPSD